MRLIATLVALALGFALEAALGQWAPQARRFMDVLLVPVAWYSIARSQRSAMLVGCVAGLLQDAWFQAGAFGIHGFNKTLLGWALGGLGARFDLNHLPGQLVGGGLLFLGERLIETGLLLMLDQAIAPLAPMELAIGVVVNGLLVAAVFTILDRVTGRDAVRGAVRRRA